MIGKRTQLTVAGLGLALGGGLLAGSAFGSPGVSSAATTAAATSIKVAATTTADTATTDAEAAADAQPAETPLEGDAATKATAAAEAAVPGGTIDRVETDNDGVHEAHVTTADGTEVVVQMDAGFKVTATVDHAQGGHGGKGGRGNETVLVGDEAAKVTAAAQAAIPDGTIDRVETDSDGSPFEAHVTKADGTQVVVKVDASFAVTSTEDMPAGGHSGGRDGGHHGHGSDADDATTAEEAPATTTA